jgi:hypothetical protein
MAEIVRHQPNRALSSLVPRRKMLGDGRHGFKSNALALICWNCIAKGWGILSSILLEAVGAKVSPLLSLIFLGLTFSGVPNAANSEILREESIRNTLLPPEQD